MIGAYRRVMEENVSVRRASIQFSVPMQTLRDRVLGKVQPDTVTTGRAPVLSMDEEARIVEHLQTVAKYGYGYTRQEVVDIASDFAVQLGKPTSSYPFTLRWFRTFLKRWPELRVLKPRSLEQCRAQSASASVVSNYFGELEKILNKYQLKDKPHLIFNIDEKGITQCHTPPSVVAGQDIHPPAVTSGRSSTTTIIVCGSASGMAVPPYFVFAGKRMVPDLMKGASPSAGSSMSDSGWSNSEIFRRYLSDHFLKFAPARDGQYILLLLDGHKSHVSIGLVDWAKSHNIILFILPAHTSHILQPMDVGCYGPFQRMYNAECHKFTCQSSCTITPYDVCELASKVYLRALSSENLQSAFKKTGIFPFNPSVISGDSVKTAEVFNLESDEDDTIDDSQKTVEGGILQESDREVEIVMDSNADIQEVAAPVSQKVETFFDSRVSNLMSLKKEGAKVKKTRRTMSAVVSGQAITEPDIEARMVKHQVEQGLSKTSSRKILPCTSSTAKGKGKAPKKSINSLPEKSKKKQPVNAKKSKSAYPVNICESSGTESDEEVDPSELCCVCGLWKPKELQNIYVLVIPKWAQCDGMRGTYPILQQCKGCS